MEGSTPPEQEQPIPEATPPKPVEPKDITRTIACGNCQSTFPFTMKDNVEEFKFNCTKCGALNEVKL